MVILLLARVVIPMGGFFILIGDAILGIGPFVATYRIDGLIAIVAVGVGILFWCLDTEHQFFDSFDSK